MRRHRAVFSVLIFLSLIWFISANAASLPEDDPYSGIERQAELPVEERDTIAPPRDGITVVTSHLGSAGDIVALSPNGTVAYHNDTHDGYWDVDPVGDKANTVVYSATEEVHNRSLCEPVGSAEFCIRQMIERVNLTTGEVSILYSRIDPRYHSSEWHDVDRINGSLYIVADMYSDEVFIVNTTSEMVVWEWSAQEHFSTTSGGDYPTDWTHLNDVEVLDDGRIMASLRNQDQVVFIDRQRGVLKNLTLGSDGDHDILYEQHNPDFIPAERGGPAVLVADSENNRIVEYQRTSGNAWERSWVWQDRRLQWGRDADRLPNGHTLVTDTHGGRVVEINRNGEVVWTFEVPSAYEAERLNTGRESTGGPSASRFGLQSRSDTDPEGNSETGVLVTLKSLMYGLIPSKILNGVAAVTPFWVGFYDILVLSFMICSLVTWLGVEAWVSSYTLRNPVYRVGD